VRIGNQRGFENNCGEIERILTQLRLGVWRASTDEVVQQREAGDAGLLHEKYFDADSIGSKA
jgi:hypothetical protein